MLRRLVIVMTLGLLPVSAAVAQVELSVPAGPFNSEDQIKAKVTNKGALPVSYCVEFGQRSLNGGTSESTPMPFYVEQRNGEKWSVLLIGPDIGSSRHAVELEPGSSQEFPFRLLDKGDMRLVLHYWTGNRDDVCSGTAKGRKKVKSRVFSIASN